MEAIIISKESIPSTSFLCFNTFPNLMPLPDDSRQKLYGRSHLDFTLLLLPHRPIGEIMTLVPLSNCMPLIADYSYDDIHTRNGRSFYPFPLPGPSISIQSPPPSLLSPFSGHYNTLCGCWNGLHSLWATQSYVQTRNMTTTYGAFD